MLSRLTIAAVLCAFPLTMCCCSGSSKVAYARAYPAKAQAESVDVQVRREETTITVVNTSSRAFPESTLWLNAQFSKPIAPLAVGQTATYDLWAFRNEFSEPFRAGGFFATERPDVIVLAQIELENEMLGLVVVKGTER